jgi:hypothetical protein
LCDGGPADGADRAKEVPDVGVHEQLRRRLRLHPSRRQGGVHLCGQVQIIFLALKVKVKFNPILIRCCIPMKVIKRQKRRIQKKHNCNSRIQWNLRETLKTLTYKKYCTGLREKIRKLQPFVQKHLLL